MSLDEDLDHVPILVDGPPQIVALAPDLHEDLVEVPDISEPSLATLEIACVFGSELPALT
jgi:hypothetical protein